MAQNGELKTVLENAFGQPVAEQKQTINLH
jgi:hypothetical protein